MANTKKSPNKATQAVRDARAVSKAAGERYTRKAGGEKSVNAATQAKRVTRATARSVAAKVVPPVASLPLTPGELWDQNPSGTGFNPNYDPTNAAAIHTADSALAYADYAGGGPSWRDIAKNTRSQMEAAIKGGKSMVRLPDGQTFAASQAALNMIDSTLAQESTGERKARQHKEETTFWTADPNNINRPWGSKP